MLLFITSIVQILFRKWKKNINSFENLKKLFYKLTFQLTLPSTVWCEAVHD